MHIRSVSKIVNDVNKNGANCKKKKGKNKVAESGLRKVLKICWGLIKIPMILFIAAEHSVEDQFTAPVRAQIAQNHMSILRFD